MIYFFIPQKAQLSCEKKAGSEFWNKAELAAVYYGAA
jgi:hypothetical protein